MLSVGFALAACMGWGIADFIGGFKSRNVPTLTVMIISTLAGLCCLGSILVCSRSGLPQDPHLIWALPAGIFALGAMYLLYQSLAMGTMSLLAPVSATGVVLPVIWGIVCGDTLSGLQTTGMAAAFIGTLLAVTEFGRKSGRLRATRGIFHALGAAACAGFYFIFMDTAAHTHPLWATMILRVTIFVFLVPLVLATKSPVRIRTNDLSWIIFMGVVDVGAAFSFAAATSTGMLSIVAIISSLFPAVTVLLSTLIIRERLKPVQSSGVFLAIIGVVLISGF